MNPTVVLITGASSGIGREMARQYAKRGHALVLTARRLELLEEAKKECEALGASVLAVRVDVTRDGDIDKAVAHTLESLGRLDIVVANAGFGVVGHVEQLSLEDFRRQFETNVFGVLRTFYAAADALKKSRGRFAIVGSVSGQLSIAGSSPYSMSKFAVRALANALADELLPQGVSVTLLIPGFVDSEIRKVDNQGRFHSERKDPIPSWLSVPTDKAVREMIWAIDRRRRERVITGHGKVIVFIDRHFPGLVTFVRKRGVQFRTPAQ